MKARAIFDIEFDENKIRQVFVPECAGEYISVLKGGNADNGCEETKKSIIKDLVWQQILGRHNHGEDLGSHSITVVLM